MSITFTIYPIIAALLKAEEMLGVANTLHLSQNWQFSNEKQKIFFDNFCTALSREELGGMKEIVSMASADVNILNQLLKDQGFRDIQLEPFGRPDSIGIVSIMKLALEWHEEAEKTFIKTSGINYHGLRFEAGDDSMGKKAVLFELPNRSEPLIMIPTKNKDIVLLTASEEVPADAFELLNNFQNMSKSLDDEYQNKEPEELVTKKYAGVVIPQILLDQTPDISWLKDMEINDSQDITQFIAQALQQTKLELNEKGVKVESAVAIEMQVRCCISDTPAKKPDYILDKPFMIAIGGVDSSDPNFMGYITPEDWVVA